MNQLPNIQQDEEGRSTLVKAAQIAKGYDVTPRYILQLAAEGKIPSLRLGKKCIRFDINAVSKALNNQT